MLIHNESSRAAAKLPNSGLDSNDSLECRNCHELASMDSREQSTFASQSHERALQQQMTCIDCHQGIVHSLPEEFLDREHERFEEENIDCGNCHEDLRHEQDRGDEDW